MKARLKESSLNLSDKQVYKQAEHMVYLKKISLSDEDYSLLGWFLQNHPDVKKLVLDDVNIKNGELSLLLNQLQKIRTLESLKFINTSLNDDAEKIADFLQAGTSIRALQIDGLIGYKAAIKLNTVARQLSINVYLKPCYSDIFNF